mmetsp:Transcript_8964/g.11284  ORF Transcript_8964/g.11284 Transcript_8964/m.11284 type:complete len:268 (+) Transcript_8964:148-951(+)
MGRSQVERNRTHGRPGGRKGGTGRGRGGQNKNRTSQKQDLGSNTFRYEKESNEGTQYDYTIDESSSDISMEYTYYSSANEYGLSHHDGQTNTDETLTNYNSNKMSIDVKLLSKCLEQDEKLSWLRLDNTITGLFHDKYYKKERNMTVSEMRFMSRDCTSNDVELTGDTDTATNIVTGTGNTTETAGTSVHEEQVSDPSKSNKREQEDVTVPNSEKGTNNDPMANTDCSQAKEKDNGNFDDDNEKDLENVLENDDEDDLEDWLDNMIE